MSDPRIAGIRSAILRAAGRYDKSISKSRVRDACDYAQQLHQGQTRRSGEPYVIHPLRVALLCAQAKLDEPTIVAAILHDAIEDTELTDTELKGRYGAETFQIVDGLTKVPEGRGRYSYKDLTYQKLLDAGSQDVRVLLIKIFDSLDNIRTVEALEPWRQRKFARETMIYARIARRLGIWNIAREMATWAGKVLYPGEAEAIERQLRASNVRSSMQSARARLQHLLGNRGKVHTTLQQVGSFVDWDSGVLTLPSDRAEFYDVVVLTRGVASAYHCLGRIHMNLQVIPGGFKDYIANPKENNYQAIHTWVFLRGRHRVRICTPDMEEQNQSGILHSFHRDAGAVEYCHQYLQHLKSLTQSRDLNQQEVSDSFKREDLVVLTPDGDPRSLTQGSTVLDFAFHIHSELGEKALRALVNGKPVGLNYKLAQGDSVKIITSPSVRVERWWFDVAQTVYARKYIRRAFKRRVRQRARELGRAAIGELLLSEGVEPDSILTEMDRDGDFFEDVLYRGPRACRRDGAKVHETVRNILEVLKQKTFYGKLRFRVTLDDPFFVPAADCSPLPGESVVCELSRDDGGVLHRTRCPEVDAQRTVDTSWELGDAIEHLRLDITCRDKPGIVSEVLSTFRQAGVHLSEIQAYIDAEGNGRVSLDVTRVEPKTLSRIAWDLRALTFILRVDWGLPPPSATSQYMQSS